MPPKSMMMKRIKFYLLISFSLLLLAVHAQEAPRVKYAFLFIGDGMGMAQVNLTQAYLSALDGETGMKPLTFTQFPSTGMVSTFAETELITCSAAAGTALATGKKTGNGRISMSSDKSEIYPTIAEKAKNTGKRIGIVTNVSLDHATPATFYAHQPTRDMHFEIGYQLVTSRFDYFAGGGFLDPVDTVNGTVTDLLEAARNNGFTVVDNTTGFKQLMNTRQKTIVVAPNPAGGATLPYAMDMGPGDIGLDEFTAKGIELLDNPEGFFMMVEGGKIDWASHANDAGATIHETLAFDKAVAIAFDFYKQHPNETIIVVTADHETGGLSLGNRMMKYETNLALFRHQKSSFEKFTMVVKALREKKTGKPDEDLKKFFQLLDANLGLHNMDNGTLLTDEEKATLKAIMEETMYNEATGEDTYGDKEPLAAAAIQILANRAGVSWGSNTHTFISVPVFAIGAGAEEFTGVFDNTDLPGKLERLMGID